MTDRKAPLEMGRRTTTDPSAAGLRIGVEATNLRSQQLGGVWRYTESLIRALGRVPSPHRYSLLFFNAFKPWGRVSPPSVTSPAMELVEVRSVPNFLFALLTLLISEGSAGPTVESFLGPVDVFHSVNAVVLPQRRGRRVVTVHDLTCLRFPRYHPWSRRLLFSLALRRTARLADAIIVPSASTKRDLTAWFRPAEAKIRVVPLAPREHFVPIGPSHGRSVVARYGLRYGEYLLFAGNVEPRKNLLGLIDAYDRLRRSAPAGPRLVIAGGAGWKNRRIHRAVSESPFTTDITLLGHIPDADLPALMNGAIAFIYPSLYEGFGLPPLEAMACGTPVITSNCSSLPEVVGDASLLVSPEDTAELVDAMARIVDEEALRENLRDRGLKQAERFSWEETACLTLRVYEGFNSKQSR